ncbi:MAG: peptidase family protein [Conexibacter sp.]|nr:peptidase family protein [Conexibacter sp.]
MASICAARHGLVALRELGSDAGVRLLVTAGEEIGSPTSMALIAALAAPAAAVLVPEPPLPDGSLKTRRKTAAIEIRGRAAHAGVAPHEGVDANSELARLVTDLRALAASFPGSSITVGRMEGGTAANVVAEHARAEVDFRARTTADLEALAQRIRALRPLHPEAEIDVASASTGRRWSSSVLGGATGSRATARRGDRAHGQRGGDRRRQRRQPGAGGRRTDPRWARRPRPRTAQARGARRPRRPRPGRCAARRAGFRGGIDPPSVMR